MQPKKQLILCVLNILNNESDENHPITQTKIANDLSELYPCDRKTVCRNIKFLQEMGYPIKKTNKGFYMAQKIFSMNDVLFVKNAIMSASGKSEFEKAEIAERVATILNKAYRR